ncbi:MAG: heme-binding protein [Cloacibacillus sp.]
MDIAKALKMIEKAQTKANEFGASMAFSVFDASQEPVFFYRMDGTENLSAQLASAKALTALKIGADTEKVAYLVKKDTGVLRNIRYETEISLIGGGKLIFDNETLIGAIGVSGGSEDEDIAVASAAISN